MSKKDADQVTLEVGSAPTSSGASSEQPGFVERMKKRAAGANWTWTLRILCFISGCALIAAGFNAFFSLYVNILQYVVSAYVVIFGLLVILVLIPFPPAWKKLNMKWVPFLHTYRGRGLFLIFVGSLSAGLGGTLSIMNIVIGCVVVAIGVLHFLIACFFRNSLAPSNDFNNQRGGPKPGELKAELTSAAAKAAWDNRNTIGKAAAYANK